MKPKEVKANEMFITESAEITNAVKTIFRDAKWIKCAVAYWGKGACDEIFHSVKTKDVKIIANVFSGGCNPLEIKQMINSYSGNIFYDNNLHAKVFLSDLGVVVGSANASTNGMGFEGSEAKSLNEAVILSKDSDTIASVSIWFEHMLEIVHKNRVESTHIKVITDKWKRQLNGRTFNNDFLKSIENGDYDNRYIDSYIVIAEDTNDSTILNNGKKAIQNASKVFPGLFNTKSNWYHDVSGDFPFGKNVFGFIRDPEKNNKIDHDGNYLIAEQNCKISGYKKYTFCNPTKELPPHKNQIKQLLKVLLQNGMLPKDGEIVLKIVKQGVKCIYPDSKEWLKIGRSQLMFKCSEIRKFT